MDLVFAGLQQDLMAMVEVHLASEKCVRIQLCTSSAPVIWCEVSDPVLVLSVREALQSERVESVETTPRATPRKSPVVEESHTRTAKKLRRKSFGASGPGKNSSQNSRAPSPSREEDTNLNYHPAAGTLMTDARVVRRVYRVHLFKPRNHILFCFSVVAHSRTLQTSTALYW